MYIYVGYRGLVEYDTSQTLHVAILLVPGTVAPNPILLTVVEVFGGLH